MLKKISMLIRKPKEEPSEKDTGKHEATNAPAVIINSEKSETVAEIIEVAPKPKHNIEGTDVGIFEALPDEMIFSVISFLDVLDICALCQVSKKMQYYADHNHLWKSLVVRTYHSEGLTELPKEVPNWKTYFKICMAPTWKWSSTKKAPVIELSNDDLTAALRPSREGSNPAVLGNKPFGPNSDYFEVTVDVLGEWIGIGVVDSTFVLNESQTIGGQTAGFNSSYYWQGGTYVRCSGITSEDWNAKEYNPKPILEGDVISVYMDFKNHLIQYFNNGEYQAQVPYSLSSHYKQDLELFPCVGMSSTTQVTITNKFLSVVKHGAKLPSDVVQSHQMKRKAIIDSIVEMGFDAQSVEQMLLACNWDKMRAIDLLVGGAS